MNRRLLLKLIAAMGLVVLLGGIVSAVIIGFTTKSAFRNLVRENDIVLSQNLASAFEEYYRRNGGWSDVEELLKEPGMMMMNQGRRTGGRMPMMERGRTTPMKIVLTDEKGKVITHSLEKFPQGKIDEGLAEDGTPLEVEGTLVGYLFVGSMVEPAFGPYQRAFLFNVYRSIALSTILVAIFATVVAALVFRNIMAPLIGLTEATKKLSRGDYEVELDTERSDELGFLSKSFQKMAEALKQADEWKRRLIADSAHELRTPIALLQGNLEMIREGMYPADQEHLDALYEETLLLSRLVGELRTLADADAGSGVYSFEEFSLGELIRHLIHTYKTEARDHNIEVELRRKSEDTRVFGDRHKLEQAVSNIISNAFRYSGENSTVMIELYKEDAQAVIAVEDSGEGIPEEERERVFERFYRTDKARNRATGGSGLGLSVTKEIVAAHAGEVEAVDPLVLGGARVMVKLPLIGEKNG